MRIIAVYRLRNSSEVLKLVDWHGFKFIIDNSGTIFKYIISRTGLFYYWPVADQDFMNKPLRMIG